MVSFLRPFATRSERRVDGNCLLRRNHRTQGIFGANANSEHKAPEAYPGHDAHVIVDAGRGLSQANGPENDYDQFQTIDLAPAQFISEKAE